VGDHWAGEVAFIFDVRLPCLARTALPADVFFMEHTVCWHSLEFKAINKPYATPYPARLKIL